MATHACLSVVFETTLHPSEAINITSMCVGNETRFINDVAFRHEEGKDAIDSKSKERSYSKRKRKDKEGDIATDAEHAFANVDSNIRVNKYSQLPAVLLHTTKKVRKGPELILTS